MDLKISKQREKILELILSHLLKTFEQNNIEIKGENKILRWISVTGDSIGIIFVIADNQAKIKNRKISEKIIKQEILKIPEITKMVDGNKKINVPDVIWFKECGHATISVFSSDETIGYVVIISFIEKEHY